MKLKLLLIPIVLLTLSACRSGYESHHGYSYDAPEIYSFNIVDSYATNSEFELQPLQVSPYIHQGEFEVFWDVESDAPYRVELYINDIPNTDYGIRLSSEWCGPYEYCGNQSYQYCYYDADLNVQCDLPETDIPYARRDISTLFYDIPEQLFLILEVCDESIVYCEYQSLPVEFE